MKSDGELEGIIYCLPLKFTFRRVFSRVRVQIEQTFDNVPIWVSTYLK